MSLLRRRENGLAGGSLAFKPRRWSYWLEHIEYGMAAVMQLLQSVSCFSSAMASV